MHVIHKQDGGESFLQANREQKKICLQANREQTLRHVQTITHARITIAGKNSVVHVDSL